MKQLARFAARLAAGVLVLAIMIGPIVAVAAVAGNPFPADLFSRISGRNVNDATIIKLLSLCFYACWAWFCLPALRQLLPARHAQVRTRTASRRPGAAATPAATAASPDGCRSRREDHAARWLAWPASPSPAPPWSRH